MTDKIFHNPRYKRTHVYLEQKPSDVKHVFKVLGGILSSFCRADRDYRLLDVGGAAGGFVAYMTRTYPFIRASCLDIDETLIARGRKRTPACDFVVGDASDLSLFRSGVFDFVTASGVLSIFDDFQRPLAGCLRVARPGGIVLVEGLFNEYPVDALIRWRYSGDEGPYHRGYNLFSKKSVSGFLEASPEVRRHSFQKFRLPFDIPPREDPIRTWTELDARGERIFRNGLMPINFEILTIELSGSEGRG